MKNTKKLLVLTVSVFAILTFTVSAFANTKNSPAESLAGLTNKTVEEVSQEKNDTGKTYGQLAEKAGKLEEFKLERSETKKAKIALRVEDGKISQEKADKLIADFEERRANCDGVPHENKNQSQEKLNKQENKSLNGENKGHHYGERNQEQIGEKNQEKTGQ